MFVFGAHVAGPDFGLYAPSRREYPLVAVADTYPVHPSLVAVVLEGPDHAEGEIGVGHVELSAEQVGCDEVAVESLAEPVPGLGLNHPLLLLAVAGEVPRVVASGKVEGPLGCHGGFDAEIDRGGRIRQYIGLYTQVLGIQCRQGG